VSSSFFNKQKIAPWRWGPGIDECGPNPQLWLRHPHNNSNPKHSNFLNLNKKTFPIFKRFEQLSSSIGRQVMTGQN